jgi:hypothetical protein
VKGVEGVGDVDSKGKASGVKREVRSDPVDCGLHAAGDPEAKLEARSKEVAHGLAEVHSHSAREKAREDLSNSDGANATIWLLESDKARGGKERSSTRRGRARKPERKDRVEKGEVGEVAEEGVA